MSPEMKEKLIQLLKQLVEASLQPDFQEDPWMRCGCEGIINAAIVEGMEAYVEKIFPREQGKFHPDRFMAITIFWEKKDDWIFLEARAEQDGRYPLLIARMNELINQAGFCAR